ncbi:MAG: shikimate kinase [Bacteroidales bacterium]|nr:shikimate kinase [Bacteroidales bacterium]
MRIYLIGYMYCGKTTIGKKLANSLGWQFIDIDQLIEERYRTSIPLFFQHYGEPLFRQIETQTLHETKQVENAVISTGGGTPCHNNNMEWINQHGTSIFLSLNAENIYSRMKASHKHRPILASIPEQQRYPFIQQQLAQRLPHYAQARHTLIIDQTPPTEIIKSIYEIINSDAQLS